MPKNSWYLDTFRLAGFSGFENLEIRAVEKPAVLRVGHVLCLYKALKEVKSTVGRHKSSPYFEQFVPLLQYLNDDASVEIAAHIDVRDNLKQYNRQLYYANKQRKGPAALFDEIINKPFIEDLQRQEVDKLSEFSICQQEKIAELETCNRRLKARLAHAIRMQTEILDEDDVADDPRDKEYFSTPTKAGKKLIELSPRKLNLKCDSSGYKNARYENRIVKFFIRLIGTHRLSSSVAHIVFKETAAFLKVSTSVPAIRTINDRAQTLVPLAMANAGRKLSTAGDNLTLAADSITKYISPHLKAGITATAFHTNDGVISIPIFACPDKSGLSMANQLYSTTVESCQTYFQLSNPSDTLAVSKEKAMEVVKNVFSKTTSFIGDGGAENSTLLDGIKYIQRLVCDDDHEFQHLSDDARIDLLQATFNEFRKANVDPSIIRFHCALHMVSLFAEHYVKIVDGWYEIECLKREPAHVSNSNTFSTQKSSFFTCVEPRKDSLVSVGNYFNTDVGRERVTKYTNFNTSIHARSYAIYMNFGVITYFNAELTSFFQKLESADAVGRYEQCVSFVTDPLCMSAVQIGAIIYHFLLLPMLCETTKLFGEPAMRIQRKLLLYLEGCSTKTSVQLLMEGDESYINEIGYGILADHQSCMKGIVFKRLLTSEEHECALLGIQEIVKQLKHYQKFMQTYYEAMTDEERAIANRLIENAPMQNGFSERRFGIVTDEVSSHPHQGFSLTMAKSDFRGQNDLKELMADENHELFNNAHKKRRRFTKDQNDKPMQAQNKSFARMSKRSHEKKSEADSLLFQLVDDVTGKINDSEYGLWQNMNDYSKAMRSMLPPLGDSHQMPPHMTRQKMQEEALRVLQCQVRFWREAVLNRFGVQLKLSAKRADEMTTPDCLEFLEAIWKHTQRRGASDTRFRGRIVVMEFETHGVKSNWDGIIVGRFPWDRNHTCYYLRFDDDPTIYPYDLELELSKGHVVNHTEVREWLSLPVAASALSALPTVVQQKESLLPSKLPLKLGHPWSMCSSKSKKIGYTRHSKKHAKLDSLFPANLEEDEVLLVEKTSKSTFIRSNNRYLSDVEVVSPISRQSHPRPALPAASHNVITNVEEKYSDGETTTEKPWVCTGRIKLYEKDMLLLMDKNGALLNNNIGGALVSMMSRKKQGNTELFPEGESAILYNKWVNPDVPVGMVMFVTTNHFAAAFKHLTGQVLVYDSMNYDGSRYCATAKKALRRLSTNAATGKSLRWRSVRVTPQSNGNNCLLHAVANLWAAVNGKDFANLFLVESELRNWALKVLRSDDWTNPPFARSGTKVAEFRDTNEIV